MKTSMCIAFALVICAAAGQAFAQSVTPINAGLVNSPIIAVNNGSGEQTAPHVSGNLTSYTDYSTGSPRIHYLNFLTSADAVIPLDAPMERDGDSGIDGTRIVFSRQATDRRAIFVYDTANSSFTEIDPHVGSQR